MASMAAGGRLPRAARRRQLIDAAAAAFLAGGFDATSMEDVAQRAGVSRLIVYRIFESKASLYRAVLTTMLVDIGERFEGVDEATIRARGAATMLVPVARRHPDAFRLLWRHAVQEPQFRDIVVEFNRRVTMHARQMIEPYVADEVILEWAAHCAGAHLIEGICTWLERGDAARDEEFMTIATMGLRGLVGAWADEIGGQGATSS